MKALGSAADKVNVFMCPKGFFAEKMATKMQESLGSVNVSIILDTQNMFRILGELKGCENCQEFRLLFSQEMELVVQDFDVGQVGQLIQKYDVERQVRAELRKSRGMERL